MLNDIKVSKDLQDELKNLADIIFDETVQSLQKSFISERKSEFLWLLEKVKSYKNWLIIQKFIHLNMLTTRYTHLQVEMLDLAQTYLKKNT